jgi:H+/Na+-translocating ferredoxin:NAD+ oxidoreductase subunit B
MANIYRKLQKHLNKQAIGYPRTISSIDVEILEYVFTKEEYVYMALNLNFRYQFIDEIYEIIQKNLKNRKYHFSPNKDEVAELLLEMRKNRCIGYRIRDDKDQYALIPYYEGLFEIQTGKIDKRMSDYHKKITNDPLYQLSLLNIYPSQHRIIPIDAAITPDHYVAPFNDIKKLVENSSGPFLKIKCPCRAILTDQNHKCKVSEDYHVCLVMEDLGVLVKDLDIGIELTKEEVIDQLRKNQEAGLVLQPSGYKKVDSICSCCSCCCGILNLLKSVKRPVDFWTSDYYTRNDPNLCTSCGICKSKCPARAITIKDHAIVNLTRCIGCGVCIPSCPEEAMILVHKDNPKEMPETRDELYQEISNNKLSFIQKIRRFNRMRKGKQWI